MPHTFVVTTKNSICVSLAAVYLQLYMQCKMLPDVGSFVNLYYNLNVKFVKKVASYIDENYILTTDMEETYLLKAIKVNDDDDIRTQEAILDVMMRLANAGFRVPALLTTKDGTVSTLGSLGKSKRSFLVLQAFLQGSLLNDIFCIGKDMNDLAFKCGQELASIARHFKGEALSDLRRPKSEWDLVNVDIYRPYVAELNNQVHEECQNAVEAFATVVVPRLPNFQQGFIHADGNASNFIVSPNSNGWNIKGVIDFGDSCMSYYIIDVATLMVYMMEKAKKLHLDMHEVAKHAYHGYVDVLPLYQEEKNVLDLVVAARLAQSLSIGNHVANMAPEKSDLIMQSLKPMSEILIALALTSRKRIYELWAIEQKNTNLLTNN